ncbi:LPXTG cell wall anchor domain-containing protein [Lentzea aerocolonigenes]|uniref:LPXTG cell wall anchor domain-containing protein n=1 Tax=Lentzea aerocolonigenes TaxID=68170 RepID=UPI000698DA63|nr:LPXTG cell wall anchor domain-containing protein [Lentzea aerocolonigenes]
MKNVLAVATTAALVLTATGLPAAAQDEKIVVEGLFYFDRNANDVYDEGDAIRKNGPGVRIQNIDTKEWIGEFRGGQDGRYRAELPKGPKYAVHNEDLFIYTSTSTGYNTGESVTNGDIPLRGKRVFGHSFVDSNGDGVFNPGEQKIPAGNGNVHARAQVTGTAVDGTQVFLTAGPTADDGTYIIEDLPIGDLTLTAPDYAYLGYLLDPANANADVDPVTRTRKLDSFADLRMRVDQRYFKVKSDPALTGLKLLPEKDAYRSGESAKAVIEVANKGNLAEKIKFILDGHNTRVGSVGGNAVRVEGNIMSLKEPLAPGATAKVDVDFTFDWDSPDSVRAFVERGDQFPDADLTNNEIVIDVRVDPPSSPTTPSSASTAPPAPSSSAPAAAPAGADTNDELASTGASPLGFLALGGLLLVAGAGAFFLARRRRS